MEVQPLCTMIVRRCFSPTAIIIAITLLSGFEANASERWSRQVSNSEWIPLADPRIASVQPTQDRNTGSSLLPSGTHLPNPIQSLSLPPVLQQQYQEQLHQLQKTQENIQKLLLLQQQLKAQQQLLQSQTYAPSGFSNEDEKQTLPPSSLSNLPTAPELTPEVLPPPHPSSEALPPVYPPQNFLSHRPGHAQQNQNLYSNQELSNLPVQGQVALQHGQHENVDDTQEGPHSYVTKHGSQRLDGKRLKGQPSPGLPQPSLIESTGDEEEEVQLVYVPAETLAQRGQPKRGRGRKQYPVRQHHHQREHQGNIEQSSLTPDQEAFARQVLQQIQKEHEEKAQFLKEKRVKEFARLNEEQKALERKSRLQQEALQREQELLRQKEADKKRKELERLEELARQRELDRIREAREKQRQEELERRRLAELRAKEEKRREEEARQREDRHKQLVLEQALKQQRILESQQQENQLRPSGPGLVHQNAQSQALREQGRRQQLTDGTRLKKIRGRQRQRVNQYQEQPHFHEVMTTTPTPNQPPLSVYMGSPTSRLESIKVTDVLRILKDAKTIAVLDTVGPNNPQVFVGPSNLDSPYGYAKFDLPYLSSIDHNRVERKVDKLPFFVAPLSFDPPPGYSKIPFPAPHIGSVVVNTLSDSSSEPDIPSGEQNPSPTPLIEPNSYSDADQSGSIATTASYDTQTAQNFSPESSSPKYESAYSTPASGSRYRFRQYYENKPPSIGTSYYGEQSTTKTKPKQYYDHELKLTTQSPKLDTTVSYRQEVSYSSTPSFQERTVNPNDPSTKEQDLAAQLALINQELAQQREAQRYNTPEQYHSQTNLGESYDANDVRAPVGPTQYNLPAELPPISPHLPGLVNSLLDKQERNPTVSSTLPPTTTTTTPSTMTTTRVNSTTYRPRGRGRIVPTRPKTTQAPASRTNVERNRRPTYNRSKSRFTTTTESYHESSYEPTKAKTPETTQKYNAIEHRRPASRTHKYRNRDRTSSQSAALDQSHNVQAQQAAGYENYPPQSDLQSNTSPDAYSPTSGAASNVHQKDTSSPGVSDFTRENYPPTTPTQTENYPPLREVTIQQGAPVMSNDYSRSQNYPQNRPQEARYPEGATYDQENSNFEQSGLERTPVNGFNYQAENSQDQTAPQRSKEYPRYQEKLENANYNLATTIDPRIRPEEHQYSPIYEANVAQAQPDYSAGKIEDAAIEADPNASPVFVPIQQSKQEDYELQIPSTETPLEITTTTTTTPAPVIIRQRVRGRLGARTHHDSAIQTRPRGSQDEYVRFSAVNHDSGRSTSHKHREGSRTRVRTRPHNHGSQVQTEGNEYIKIHGAQQQRLVATTIPPTTTSTTTTTAAPEVDVDYGFIRPPNFRPANPVHPVHPADNRFQAPFTYRPPLSEIQHIISHDESTVESSPGHSLKNRPKYQQAPNRRPIIKTFTTTTTSTTTETIPIATAMPDDAIAYTVKPKTKPEDPKPTRIRGKIRRPGKKRTTTTTESVLEANNELPLDENYPRIMPQQLPVTAAGQHTIYEDNFDVTSAQLVPSQRDQNQPVQFFEETGENYPAQQFILNFGDLPEQVPQRDEYDQTQLASMPSRKYSHSGHRGNSDAAVHSVGDIYGAESQWSTKLSRTSFQPSFAANHMVDESKRVRDRTRGDQTVENAPEIITAGPEPSSVTVMVSADYQKHVDNAGNMNSMIDVAGFGMKTNAQDHAEKSNATTAVTSPSSTTVQGPQGRIQSDKEVSPEAQNWMSKENSAERMDDSAKVAKKVADPLAGRKSGNRRRRVRVRVRPVMEDFVTAESQHFNSAVNSLAQDQYKYNPIRESRFTTAQPIATTVITTAATATTEATRKSLLQDFLEEMLKNDEVSIPTRVTVTTELPDWTISTPMTTPYAISDNGETTTMGENYTPSSTTLTPSSEEERIVYESSAGSNDESNEELQSTSSEQASRSSSQEETRKEIKSEEYWNKSSQEDKIEQNNLENSVAAFSQEYNLPSNYGSESTKEIEDTVAKLTGFPTAAEEIRKLSAINKEKEHIMTLRRQKENVEENEAHPKNHRAKWSEVRYPSAFDKSQSALKLHSTTSIPGIVTRNEGDTSVKTLSDYVKAIFDSMKNAEQEEEEEIARVVEAVNDTPINNSRFNNVASVREVSGKKTEESGVGTTDSSQEASTTQRAKIEETATNAEEAQSVTEPTTTMTTINESATTFETTTLIPDATTNTMPPSEETMITEPSTTTLATKTTTSIRQTTGNVVQANSSELGKILRTSTTTKVSHMTEICYRGRCVMTRPKMEDVMRR